MNIFLIGLPQNGSEKVAEALTKDESHYLIDASYWWKSQFRDREENEHIQQYQDEYNVFLTQSLKENPLFVLNKIQSIMKDNESLNKPFVINGTSNPKDFTHLFDYRTDMVVFLNRIDNGVDARDHENIAISCIRDYCFYLAAHGLLNKERWIEYNYKMPGEEFEFVKSLGSKNSVFIARSLDRAITHLQDIIKNMSESVLVK